VESQTSGTGLPTEGLETIRGYDDLDRLETERMTLPQAGTKLVRYGYYGNGTRKSIIDPDGLETGYTYDGQNRLKTATTRRRFTSTI
jgi:YD repeat-containing protein